MNDLGGFLNQAHQSSWPSLNALACAARAFAGIGHILLALITVSLITMPLTQHIWTWDRFLQGGQDFEFGVFFILINLCLVLLVAQHCRQSITMLVATWRRVSLIPQANPLARLRREGIASAFDGGLVLIPDLQLQSLPLLI